MLGDGIALLQLISSGDYAGFGSKIKDVNLVEELEMKQMQDLLWMVRNHWREPVVVELRFAVFLLKESGTAMVIEEILSKAKSASSQIRAALHIAIGCKHASLVGLLLRFVGKCYTDARDPLPLDTMQESVTLAERTMTPTYKEETTRRWQVMVHELRLVPEAPNYQSSIDGQLFEWLTYVDLLPTGNKIYSLMLERAMKPFPANLMPFLVSMCPFSPVSISSDMQPCIYSPDYAFVQTVEQLSAFVNLHRRLRNSREFLDAMKAVGPYIDRLDRQQLAHKIEPQHFKNILTYLMKSYGETTDANKAHIPVEFERWLSIIPVDRQPTLIKAIITGYRYERKSMQEEPMVIAFLIDQYRKRWVPTRPKSAVREDFTECLGDLWGTIEPIKYEDPQTSHSFYLSIVCLAELQARMRIRPSLLEWVQKKVLKDMKQQIGDWIELCRLKNENAKNGIAMPPHSVKPFCCETCDQDGPPILRGEMGAQLRREMKSRMEMLQFSMKQALILIEQTLKDIKTMQTLL